MVDDRQLQKEIVHFIELVNSGKHNEAIALSEKLLSNNLSDEDKLKIYKAREGSYTIKGLLDKSLNDHQVIADLTAAIATSNLKKGLLHLDANEYDNAIVAFLQAINSGRNDAKVYDVLASTYIKKKEYDKALEICTTAIKLHPNKLCLYTKRAHVYQVKKEYKNAVSDLLKVIELKSDFIEAYNALGHSYTELGEYDQAITSFGDALSIDANNLNAYFYRGKTFKAKGERDKAISDFTKIISLDPKYALAYNNRGVIYRETGEYEKAMDDFTKALELNPDYADCYDNRGNVYYLEKKYDKAISDFTRAIELAPESADVYNNRGNAFAQLKEYDKAIADYTAAIQLNPKYEDAYNNRGSIYDLIRQFDNSIADHSKAIEINPVSWASYTNRASTYVQNEKYDKAIADCTTAIEINHNNAISYNVRAIAYNKNQEYDKAIEDCAHAIRLAPSDATGYRIRALVYNHWGQYYNAIEDCKKALSINTDDPINYYNLALAYRLLGRFEDAIESFTKGIEQDQDDAFAFYSRGDAYSAIDCYDEAIRDYDKAIQLKPSDPSFYKERGFAYDEKNDYVNALNNYITALKIMLQKRKGYSVPANGIRFLFAVRTTCKKNENEIKDTIREWRLTNHCMLFTQALGRFRFRHLVNFSELLSPSTVEFKLVRVFHSIKKSKASETKLIELLEAVLRLYQKLRVTRSMVAKRDEMYLYQYADYEVLSGMGKSKNLWLTPACYQNDPEEGSFFFNFLGNAFSKKYADAQGIKIHKLCEGLCENIASGEINDITFIRCLSPYEDALMMWNSSYSTYAQGVSVGIPYSKILNLTIAQEREIYNLKALQSKLEKNIVESFEREGSEPIETMSDGLPMHAVKCCRVLYLPREEVSLDGGSTHEKDWRIESDGISLPTIQLHHVCTELNIILEKLNGFVENHPTVTKEDLLRIFLPVAHLVKNNTYQHEKEFRLMYITDILDDAKNKPFIRTEPKCLHIETEPILFMNKENPQEKVYIGPLCDSVVRLQDQHRFEKEYGIRMPFRASKANYRQVKRRTEQSTFEKKPDRKSEIKSLLKELVQDEDLKKELKGLMTEVLNEVKEASPQVTKSENTPKA